MRTHVILLTTLGLSLGACGKKADPAKPTTGQVDKPTDKPAEKPADKPADKPVEQPAEKPADKPVEQPAEKPADKPAVDRTAGVQASLEALSSGKFEEAFANFADDATFTAVGANQVATGKAAIIAWQREGLKAFPDAKLKASRIIEAGDTQITFYVLQGTNTVEVNGSPATQKAVSIAGAFVSKYDAAGKIASVHDYFDGATLMKQLGVFPGQPTDQVVTLAPWPETTEVIKAEAVPANVDLVKAFAGKIKPDTIEAAVNEHLADAFTSIDPNGAPPATGKETALAAFKAGLNNMGDYTSTVDEAYSAGEWVVVALTDTFVYKGGIPGVESKDQKVTTHNLGLAKIVDGKLASWSLYTNQLETLGQLGALGGAAAKPAEGEGDKPATADAPSFGVEVCDKLIATTQACLAAMPEVARGPAQEGWTKSLEAWKQVAAGGDAAKAQLEQTCKQALEASKTGLAAACPDVKWE